MRKGAFSYTGSSYAQNSGRKEKKVIRYNNNYAHAKPIIHDDEYDEHDTEFTSDHVETEIKITESFDIEKTIRLLENNILQMNNANNKIKEIIDILGKPFKNSNESELIAVQQLELNHDNLTVNHFFPENARINALTDEITIKFDDEW